MKYFSRQNGATLIEILASIGVVAAISTGILLGISNIMKQTGVAMKWTQESAVLNNLHKILSSPELCDNALRGSSGALLNMDFSTPAGTAVQEVYMTNPGVGAPSSLAFKVGDIVGPGLTVYSIALTEQSFGVGRTTISTLTPPYNSAAPVVGPATPYDVYMAQLTVTFALNGVPQILTPANTIPIAIAVHTGSTTDYRCYYNTTMQQVCEGSGGYIDVNGNCVSTMFDQITANGTTGYKCSTICASDPYPSCICNPVADPCTVSGLTHGIQYYLITGFDVSSRMPICTCQWYCSY